jgi:hypothetical protein
MKNYVVVVRDFNPCYRRPSDEYLFRLDRYYISPVVALDWENNRNKSIDDFDRKFRKYFSHFLHFNYELVEV